MAQHSLIAPLLNNNEDLVRVVSWHRVPGVRLSAGDPVGTVETAKAAIDLEAERDGWLRWRSPVEDETVPVGAVLAVLSDTEHEDVTVPAADAAGEPKATPSGPRRPSLRARALLRRMGA